MKIRNETDPETVNINLSVSLSHLMESRLIFLSQLSIKTKISHKLHSHLVTLMLKVWRILFVPNFEYFFDAKLGKYLPPTSYPSF